MVVREFLVVALLASVDPAAMLNVFLRFFVSLYHLTVFAVSVLWGVAVEGTASDYYVRPLRLDSLKRKGLRKVTPDNGFQPQVQLCPSLGEHCPLEKWQMRAI